MRYTMNIMRITHDTWNKNIINITMVAHITSWYWPHTHYIGIDLKTYSKCSALSMYSNPIQSTFNPVPVPIILHSTASNPVHGPIVCCFKLWPVPVSSPWTRSDPVHVSCSSPQSIWPRISVYNPSPWSSYMTQCLYLCIVPFREL